MNCALFGLIYNSNKTLNQFRNFREYDLPTAESNVVYPLPSSSSCSSRAVRFTRSPKMETSSICRYHSPPLILRNSPPKFVTTARMSRFRTTLQLQSSANGRPATPEPSTSLDNSSSVPVHKVTVNDRQRGVVHEFLVPEVWEQMIVTPDDGF